MKSSFNTQNVTEHSTDHNSRKSKVNYLFEYEKPNNEYKLIENWKDFKSKAEKIYKEKIGQRMQPKQKDALIKEAVINLYEHHTIEDLKYMMDNLNKELGGHYALEFAVHRDEGVFVRTKYNINEIIHDSEKFEWYDKYGNNITDEVEVFAPNRDIFYNEENKTWYFDKKFTEKVNIDELQKYHNYHAHIIYTNFDTSTGKTARLDKSAMRKLQTIVAESLNMERGKENSSRKRENHWQRKRTYDKVNQEKKERVKVKKELSNIEYNYKDLQSQIIDLKEANSEQKKSLHRLNSKIKNTKNRDEKDKLILELRESLEKFKPKSTDIKPYSIKSIMEFVTERGKLGFTEKIDKKKLIEVLEEEHHKITTLREIINSQPDLSELEKLLKDLRINNKKLREENKRLKEQLIVMNKLKGEVEIWKSKANIYRETIQDQNIEINDLKEELLDLKHQFSSFEDKEFVYRKPESSKRNQH